MSQPCFFAHHNATAESTPPDKRTIARSIRLPPNRWGPQPFAVQAANRRLPPHKYLSQTREMEGRKGFQAAGGGGRWYGCQRTWSSSSIPSRGSPCQVARRSPYRSSRIARRCRSRCTMSSVSPDETRTARTIPRSLHMTNRWSPRVTSWTSPSLSVNASRTNDEIAEIMLPTTSRSLSLIRLRDMCLISRLFELITKTSSMSGSGVEGTSSAGGGGAAVVVVGIRLIVTSIFFGASFRPGTRCQRSDDAHANARPAPITSTHPARGVQVVLKLPPAYCPRNCGTGILRFVLAAGGIVNTIANEAYSDEAQEARKAIPAYRPRSFFQTDKRERPSPPKPAASPRMKNLLYSASAFAMSG